ncbi:hypothetical protein Pmar_PMAR008231 [Perkinsus marinus ATCC 50983]|uniref:Uncharacterized protein n=1 Tax=Perkinsus marinus (strain ATCC 50983 / TXsc) TaxID=423536 RepID=C5LNN3_PERM5|nr:hypothetical protein Pmar_PMAR008231 [Perkinsus marinus ATCC 50983]EER01652.1 hypothetical protein Pmar_PMAR008231 [Perkinsus marinus ATCC 50983]|eukprot:XP_002768934.1 hypothetical protein Pmar_PMAR008231 [Perkinsus marinus ATCC 50983]
MQNIKEYFENMKSKGGSSSSSSQPVPESPIPAHVELPTNLESTSTGDAQPVIDAIEPGDQPDQKRRKVTTFRSEHQDWETLWTTEWKNQQPQTVVADFSTKPFVGRLVIKTQQPGRKAASHANDPAHKALVTRADVAAGTGHYRNAGELMRAVASKTKLDQLSTEKEGMKLYIEALFYLVKEEIPHTTNDLRGNKASQCHLPVHYDKHRCYRLH